MQRSMSYRKPVPTYIPSPPSSPQSTFTPSTQPNLDLGVPPLPPNWREALDQVSTLPRLNAKSCQLLPAVNREYIEMDMTELASSVVPECPKGGNLTVHHRDKVAFPGTQSTSNVPWTQKRRLHRQYRPPTPPIPSQHKSRHYLLNPDNNSELTLAQDVHRRIDRFGLYHDYPRGGPGASSLKISSSFMTDKTMSFNISNPSVGWFQGMTSGELSNYPSLLNHEHDRHLHGIAGDPSESMESSCWESLGVWAKKLRNFVIICM